MELGGSGLATKDVGIGILLVVYTRADAQFVQDINGKMSFGKEEDLVLVGGACLAGDTLVKVVLQSDAWRCQFPAKLQTWDWGIKPGPGTVVWQEGFVEGAWLPVKATTRASRLG